MRAARRLAVNADDFGFTRDVTVGVWVGNFDRTPLRNSTGVTGAGPIFHDVMLAAIERTRGSLPLGDVASIVPVPADVHRIELCASSGMAPHASCPTRTVEWIPTGASLGRCTWHHASDGALVTVWPEPFKRWARSGSGVSVTTLKERRNDVALPVALSSERRPDARRHLTIVRPLGGAVYLIDPTLRPEFQTLPLRASGVRGGEVQWSIDGVEAGRSSGDAAFHWPLALGPHKITARDASGP